MHWLKANGSNNSFVNSQCCHKWCLQWTNEEKYILTCPVRDLVPWPPSQYPKRRLSVKSHKVSKPRDWYFKLLYRFEIWQALRQHCLSNVIAIGQFWIQISRLRDFTRSYGKTSFRILRRGPGSDWYIGCIGKFMCQNLIIGVFGWHMIHN